MNLLGKLAPAMLLIATQPVVADDLLGIYQQALQADPQLRTAELKVDVGNAQKGQALGQLLPQITGTANWSSNKQSVPGFTDRDYNGTRYYVSLSQSLIDFAKFWDWKRAQEVENQYSAELTEAQHTLIFSVVQRYFAALDAEDQLQLTQMERQATETELEQVKKQFAKQLIKVTDLYEVEARLDQLKADEIEAGSNLIIARQAMKELTNTLPTSLNTLREGIEYHELEGKLDDWIAVAKSQNPQLAAQQSAIEAASNNVAVQKSRYLPVVDLQLNYFDTDTGYQSVQTSHTQTQVAAINVNVPIFTGGTTTHRMFEAQSRLAMTQEENEAKVRALVKETSDAFSASNANARRISASEKALTSATKSREAMQSGLKYGVQTIADVLRAQQVEYKAKRELAKAKYEYIINRVRFLKAIGTVNEENLQEVNGWLSSAADMGSR
ncbi:TolC family outer membrane protein [Methylomonas albis]|uniref:TolC family outer membrane protein n=1 Tax=Methylomonas albis TaxID=1854563 RepID=A0ABR9D544_9GAMM|nr:TolC family outer membrane protein [Methylomonas albis]MBD9357383.1 TolC family outer membrane protein [Methylomonas albis]